MKKANPKTVILLMASIGLFSGIGPVTTANAKTTYLPSNIRNHTWYRLTDGAQGGYHDKTQFKGNHMTLKTVTGKSHWYFTGLKRHHKNTYYGRLHYSKKSSKLVKIKLFNTKHFDIIPKHIHGLKGNYTGNEQYGATIFKR